MSSLTVAGLARRLAKLIREGHGRKPVLVYKSTFTHPLEGDGCVMLPVCKVEYDVISLLDGDGGMQTNARGEESLRQCVLLLGEGEDKRHERE